MNLIIPANQVVKKGELFRFTIDNLLSVYLRATDDTSSASYDTEFTALDFNPFIHGFKGMNLPLCIFVEKVCSTNIHAAEYLVDKGILV